MSWSSKASRVAALAVGAVCAVSLPAPAQDIATALESSYPTNLNMLTGAASAAVNELFLNFTLPEGSSLLVESEAQHEGQWFVQNLLLNRFTESGFTVYLKHTEPPPESPAPAPESRRAARPGVADTTAPADTAALDSAAAETASALAEPDPDPEPEPEPDRRPIPKTDYIFRFRVAECALAYPSSYKKSPLGSRTVQRQASVSLFATLLHGEREDVVWVGRGDAERLDLVPAGKLSLLEGKTFPFTKPVLRTRGMGTYVEPALVTGIVAGLIYLFYTNQN
jgi:hypothetical protein